MPTYEVYGLRVRSDSEIAGFPAPVPPAAEPVDVDVDVVFDAPHGSSGTIWSVHQALKHVRGDDSMIRVEQDAAGGTALEWSDGARFEIDRDARVVRVLTPPGMSRDSICIYLVNTIMALCLRTRGTTCLHASAIEVDGRAVAFAAPSGSGKSTLAYGFVRAGYQLLADDVTALQLSDGVTVPPAYPRLRLWPWTVEGLLGDPDALPPLCEDWEKRAADVPSADPRSRRLGAVVLLEGFGDEVVLRRLPPGPALAGLLQNVSLNKLLQAPARREDAERLLRVLDHVPVMGLRRPLALDRVDESVRAVAAALTQELVA